MKGPGTNGAVPPWRGPGPRLRFTRRARYIGRAITGVASALVLIAAGVGWYLQAEVLGGLVTSDALDGRAGSGGDLNILLMGLDSRRDSGGDDLPAATLARLHAGSSSDVGGYNTNTLILVHMPRDGKHAVALSLPRDDYVDLPDGLGKHKIKEAYGRAKEAAESAARTKGTTDRAELERMGREAGRKATIETVRNLLGVTVDHFAEVNMVGFYDLANALGGVRVCLNRPVSDAYSGAEFPAGVQTLDGAQALAFVRQRHGLPNGDLDRARRQQAFLASTVHQLRSEGVFSDLGRMGPMLDAARRDLVVDSGFDLPGIVKRVGALASGGVAFFTLPIEGYATVDGESVNLVDPARLREAARQLLAGGPLPTATTREPEAARSAGASAAAGPQAAQAVSAGPRVARVGGEPGAQNTPSARAAVVSAPPGVPCVD
jgi:LCP family protein required for cell wall assembly